MGLTTVVASAGAAKGLKANSSSHCPCVCDICVTARPASAGTADAAQATTSGRAQEVAQGLQAQQQQQPQQQPPHQPPPRLAGSSTVAGLPAGHTQQLVEGHQAQGQGGGQTPGPPGSGGREAGAAAKQGGVKSPPARHGEHMSFCMCSAVCCWSGALL